MGNGMTEKSRENDASNDASTAQKPADTAETSAREAKPDTAAGIGAAEAREDAQAQIARENAALKDQLLRIAAEMENLRRRTARDVHDARTYAIANFARDMLNVSDNLRRALDAIPAEALEDGNEGLKALAEGVDLTERSLLDALDRHGVKKLEPEGQKFDANFHHAMFEVPDASVPNNTVVRVVQAGYIIGDRVLRPAMVGIAKGGPKQPAATGDQPAEPGPIDASAEHDA
jgi:molecular chaperone GrpE